MKSSTFISMEANNNLALQIGRSVISLQVAKEWQVQSCCM